jgi:hypothetical protein
MVPIVGIILPIVMWLAKKDEYEEVNAHGKIIINWICSFTIYLTVVFVVAFIFLVSQSFFIMAPIVMLGSGIAFLNLIFIVVGAIKAHENTLWQYPLSIRFFK